MRLLEIPHLLNLLMTITEWCDIPRNSYPRVKQYTCTSRLTVLALQFQNIENVKKTRCT